MLKAQEIWKYIAEEIAVLDKALPNVDVKPQDRVYGIFP